MGELLSIFWPSHAQQLSDGMWKCLQECFKTDFVISVNKNDGVQRLVKAHYLMLSIFCPSIKNSDERILDFDHRSNVDEEDLRFLLEFIYRGKTKIPVKRMGNLKAAAQLLGLKVLVDSIEKCEKCRQASTDDEEAATASEDEPAADDEGEAATSDEENTEEKTEENSPTKMMTRNSTKNSLEIKRKLSIEATIAARSAPKRSRRGCGGAAEGSSSVQGEDSSITTPCESQLSKSKVSDLDNTSSFDFISQTCHLCDKKFNNKNAFRRHVRCHLEPNIMQQCPHCPAKFPNSKQVVSHVALKHQMDMEGNRLEKKFKCDECDFTSVYQSSIKNHKAYKHGVKTQKCDQCSYSCHNYADLLQHKDGVHSDLRPYMCDSCGFRAKTKSSIRLHLTMHQEKIPCDICGALYKYRALSRHKRNIHCANKKGFACLLCPYATSCKSYLQTHMTKVHKLIGDSRARNPSATESTQISSGIST